MLWAWLAHSLSSNARMTYTPTATGFIIRLSKGEKIIEQLQRFCRDKGIFGAHISGIGGATRVEVGFYDLDTREYHFIEYTQTLEITSLSGNVSQVDGEPFLHLHVTLSDENNAAFGGHLKEAVVGGTCEIYLVDYGIPVERTVDEETGLKLLSLE